MNSSLFSPLKIRDLNFSHRIFVSPMCQYSAKDGLADHWHLVHLGSRAVGGAALVMVEATAVSPLGRISLGDLGLWNKEQMRAFKPITEFIKGQGSVPAIQIAHAGRKASSAIPWEGKGMLSLQEGGWETLAPSPLPFQPAADRVPKGMTDHDLKEVSEQFVRSVELAYEAGFQVVEIHMAHGYLLHEFLSPLSNHRRDDYGGTLENRTRYPIEIARKIRKIWPSEWPIFVRISATDWVEGGWTIEDSIYLSQKLKEVGVDLIDCSTGGNHPHAEIPISPGYQVPFARRIRQETHLLTGAVGLITDPQQAEDIIASGKADVVFLAREFLKDPYWPLRAAKALKTNLKVPNQYLRAF